MIVNRPLMRYYGGKWRLAPWIIENMPAHRCYTEAFGGAASVLLRKPRCYSEIYPALNVIRRYDGPETLHYVDPPYVYETRNARNAGSTYRHELTDEQHIELAIALHGLRGFVMLSGYSCPLYDDLYGKWTRSDHSSHADGARDRTECLWINRPIQPTLFQEDTHD